MARFLFVTLLTGLVLWQPGSAQQSDAPKAPATNPPQQTTTPQPVTNFPQAPSQDGIEDPGTKFGVTVQQVTTPVLVYDSNGNYVNGLRPEQFHLFDNMKEQNIRVDEAFEPLSLVILIQANSAVEHMLPTISKVGNLVGPLILGDRGEAAVVAFDSRIRTLQDFTTDPDKITQAVKKIQAGSSTSRLVDAVEQADHMLRNRPANRRRVVVLISETQDRGSEARGRETLTNLNMHNIVVYPVDISRLLATLNGPTPYPRPDNRPPAMTPVPANQPATPNTVMQMTGGQGDSAQAIPLLVEIYRDAKAIFRTTPSHLFSKGTGGTEYSYYKEHGLDQAFQDIAEQLHNEYMISYRPNNADEGGFHTITFSINSPAVKRYQARPGYWLAARVP
jgi:VWFA-related protein